MTSPSTDTLSAADLQNTSSSVGAPKGARRATEGAPTLDHPSATNRALPDPDVRAVAPRRRFTAKYKLSILQQADSCTQAGQIGALLRREGLYSSHLTCWRRQREQGLLEAMSAKKRGKKASVKNPLAAQVARLQAEKQQLENQLKQAHLIIEAQKKISEIFGAMQCLKSAVN